MARIRTIKPEFWTDPDVVELTPWARLLFIGMWNFAACRQGHIEASAKRLKMQILPADDVAVDDLLAELLAAGMVVREDAKWLRMPNFDEHQKTDKRWTPTCVACGENGPESEGFLNNGVPEGTSTAQNPENERRATPSQRGGTPSQRSGSTQEGKGREGKGKEGKREGDKSPTPSTKGTRLPEDWMPDQAVREQMQTEFPHVDFRGEHAKFTDHWLAASGANATKKDWNAAWRNWIRRSVEFSQRAGKPAPAPDPRLAKDHVPDTCQRCTGLLHPTEVRAGHDRCENCRAAA